MKYSRENYDNSRNTCEFEFECQECHNIFYKTKSEISKNRGKIPKFCSLKCAYLSRNKGYITVKCKNCGKENVLSKSDYDRRVSENKDCNIFCNSSCAAIYNNKLYPKRHKSNIKNICPICGGVKSNDSKMCMKCKTKGQRDFIKERELGFYIGYENKNKYLSSKCSVIRKDAKKELEMSGIERVCAYCKNHEFDSILEVHHKKSITSFSPYSKIMEVNSIDNLVWLCPNHHAMLEKGLITLN